MPSIMPAYAGSGVSLRKAKPAVGSAGIMSTYGVGSAGGRQSAGAMSTYGVGSGGYGGAGGYGGGAMSTYGAGSAGGHQSPVSSAGGRKLPVSSGQASMYGRPKFGGQITPWGEYAPHGVNPETGSKFGSSAAAHDYYRHQQIMNNPKNQWEAQVAASMRRSREQAAKTAAGGYGGAGGGYGGAGGGYGWAGGGGAAGGNQLSQGVGGGVGGAMGAGSLKALQQYGQQFMDPNSAYMRQLREVLSSGIGEDVEAQKRLAAFEAAQSGYGTGESAELMSNLADIGAAGTEAYGRAVGETALAGPGMGLDALKAGLSGELGFSAQDLQRWQTLQTLQQQQREAGMESAYRGRALDLESQRLADQSMWNQLALMFG